MIDKATDSNTEQVVLVLHYVKEDFTVAEEFTGLYQTDAIDSHCWLLRMNLKLQYCCGQCYDEVSNMRGSRNSVTKYLLMKNLVQCTPTAKDIL